MTAADESDSAEDWRSMRQVKALLRARLVDPPYLEGETEHLMFRGEGGCVCSVCGYTYRLHPDYMGVLGHDDSPFLQVLCDGTLVHL